MELSLERIEQRVGAEVFLRPLDLALVPGAVTVLLGATQAGKTTLMRVMAGLDAPSHGRVLADGVDVTGRPVRERNVAMVYQQFINYPSMTVRENIGSPLKLRREKDIAARVEALATRLHIEPFLDRLPAELSGGQQQRVALARALAKNAPLMLLDEPLVNLDYKLREELRNELSQLFANGSSTVVYATTEPTEALLLGGHTAVLDAGELLQYGPTAAVFHRPKSIRVARAFSDPPMNLVAGTAGPGGIALPGGVVLALTLPDAARGAVTVGVRAGALRVDGRPGDIALPGTVELAEISGSDTFLHVDTAIGELVAQLTGVHVFALGEPVRLFLDPSQAYVFDAAGDLLSLPERPDMARIDLDLAHAYRPNPVRDDDYALLPLKMSFVDGGAYALLGPSGCGKTTLLNIVSGLVKPSQGSVSFDGVDVTARTPQQRNIAQVFQFPVIYDTMTVAENLAFPLRNRGVAPERIAARVGKVAEMLELSGQLGQRAAGLAADAKQKISLGRGLVREDVSAVLFDEPLTVIDPHLKWQLRRKLKQIHQELKLTLIYVTHDQVEALTFAEQVVVMTRGRAVQIGTASELFDRPRHTFVGHFIGSPGMNFLPAHAAAADAPPGATQLGIRPEYVTLAAAHAAGAVAATVTQAQDIGTYWLLTARLGQGDDAPLLRARIGERQAIPRVGETAWLGIVGAHTCWYRGDVLIGDEVAA